MLSLAALEIFALSDWLLWLPHFWFHENQSKSALSDTFTLQSVPCNGSQVTYRLMIGSSLLLLRLSQKGFRHEGALPSNHPESLENLPSDISLERPFQWTSHVEGPRIHRIDCKIQINWQLIDTRLHKKKQSFISSLVVVKHSGRNAWWATYVDPPSVPAKCFLSLLSDVSDWIKILLYSSAGLMSWNIILHVEALVLFAFPRPCCTFPQAILS